MRQIDLVFSLFAIAFSIPQFGMAQNQTLRINIELPAGVGLTSGSSSMPGPNTNGRREVLQDIFGAKNFALITEDCSFVPLVWIKMQTYENSQFLFDFKNKDLTNKSTLFYFLNNNTNNFQSAQSLNEFPALLNFNQNGLLIRSFVPRKIKLSSWLGFNGENQQMTLVFEYF